MFAGNEAMSGKNRRGTHICNVCICLLQTKISRPMVEPKLRNNTPFNLKIYLIHWLTEKDMLDNFPKKRSYFFRIRH